MPPNKNSPNERASAVNYWQITGRPKERPTCPVFPNRSILVRGLASLVGVGAGVAL